MEIDKNKLKKLVENFYRVTGFCEELDIYEMEDLAKSLERMENWVDENFGKNLENLK